jgi:hypothetical protein
MFQMTLADAIDMIQTQLVETLKAWFGDRLPQVGGGVRH